MWLSPSSPCHSDPCRLLKLCLARFPSLFSVPILRVGSFAFSWCRLLCLSLPLSVHCHGLSLFSHPADDDNNLVPQTCKNLLQDLRSDYERCCSLVDHQLC